MYHIPLTHCLIGDNNETFLMTFYSDEGLVVKHFREGESGKVLEVGVTKEPNHQEWQHLVF